MHIEPVESLATLNTLKQQYLEQTTAPLDGMWLHGFVPAATHYGYREGDELRGFFCVNDEGYLLQFFVDPRARAAEASLFEHAIVRGASAAGTIEGAFVSTAEPHLLSLCLDVFGAFAVNALMYQIDEAQGGAGRVGDASIALARLVPAQLSEAVAFAVDAIGAPEGWLTGYYAQLIERGELYGAWSGDRLVATGERRHRDDPRHACADLGVVVARSHRGQGLATRILSALVAMNDREGVRSICSTERDNRAAQRAITKAGFVAHHRIVRFDA